MYLKVEIDNNNPHQQWCWCNLLLLRNLFTLIDLIIVIIVIWDDNNNIIVVYEAVSSMITSLTVAVTSFEMLWHMTTFQKKHHTVFLTVCTTVRNQHITSLNKDCIYVQWLMRQNLLSQNSSLYKENIMIKESKNDNDLKRVNEGVQLLRINQKNRICIICCSNKSVLIQNKSSTCCQIWETNLYNTYIIVVAAVVAAECVIQESVLKGVNWREFSHMRDCDEEVEEVNCYLIVQNRKSHVDKW